MARTSCYVLHLPSCHELHLTGGGLALPCTRHCSMQEMDAVAKFMRQRGRVSISELSENSHKLIRLQSEAKSEKAKDASK